MGDIDLGARDPKTLIGWTMEESAFDRLVVCLEYVEPGKPTESLTLAIPLQAAMHLAEELARRVAPDPLKRSS